MTSMWVSLLRAWRIWRALVSLAYSISIAYRAQAVLWMVSGCLPLIMMMIWLGLAADGPMGGYSQADFGLYFMFMFFARQMTPVWVIYLLDRGIRQGELSTLLLRPVHPIWTHAAEHIAELMVRLPIVLVVTAVGLWLTGAWGAVDPRQLPPYFLTLALGWMIAFNLHYAVGQLAFWTESVMQFEALVWQLISIFGGVVIPIDLFPAAAQAMIRWTPFPYIMDFPVRVMLGRVDTPTFWLELGIQLAWIVALILLRRVIWRAGLRRFSGAGA